jgi:hypothetical protein
MWYNAMFTIHDWEWYCNHTRPPITMVILGMFYGIVLRTLFGIGFGILVTLPSLVLQIYGKDLRQFKDLLASFFCGPNPDFLLMIIPNMRLDTSSCNVFTPV